MNKPTIGQSDKQIFKEALKEWMDEKFATFGKWTLSAIGAAALVALVYLILLSQGWRAP